MDLYEFVILKILIKNFFKIFEKCAKTFEVIQPGLNDSEKLHRTHLNFFNFFVSPKIGNISQIVNHSIDV